MTTTYDPAWAKRWRHDRAHGRLRLVDAHPVRLHIATLQGAGMSRRAIAGESGVSAQAVCKLANGQAHVRRTVAAKILAVDVRVPGKPSRQTDEPFVPKVGAVRRVQALLAIGWTHAHISAVAGIPNSAVTVSQQGVWITRTTHDRIAAAYRNLSRRPGPSQRTTARAAARGYLSPAYWDDIDHDPYPEPEQEHTA